MHVNGGADVCACESQLTVDRNAKRVWGTRGTCGYVSARMLGRCSRVTGASCPTDEREHRRRVQQNVTTIIHLQQQQKQQPEHHHQQQHLVITLLRSARVWRVRCFRRTGWPSATASRRPTRCGPRRLRATTTTTTTTNDDDDDRHHPRASTNDKNVMSETIVVSRENNKKTSHTFHRARTHGACVLSLIHI